jgi:putative aldouronate transport system substrate-binding protein
MRQSLSRLSILALVLLVAAVGMVSAEGPVIRWSGFYEFNKNATPETLVMKWVGEATGTTLQPMHVEQGDMSTWWSTTLASLDFPDVMQYFGTMGDDPNIYGPQGLFVALDVEREAGNMPNLDRVFTAWDADNYQRFAPDGHVYLANRLDTRFLTPRVPGFVLRSDLMEAAGYDPSVPDQFTDVDQVQEAILAMKPHWDAMFGGPTTGMHTRGDRGIRSGGQLPRVMYKDEFAADTAMQMEPDNVWRFGPLDPKFKEGIQFLRDMHAHGILHPDWLTMSEEDQSRLDWSEGKVHFNFGRQGNGFEPRWFERLCRQDTRYSSLCGITSYAVVAPTVLDQKIYSRPGAKIGSGLVIDATSETAEAAVRVADFLYSDEGATITRMGIEGYAWVRDDTPGNMWGRRWTKCWSGSYPKEACDEDPDRSLTRGENIGWGPLSLLNQPTDSWGIDWTDFYWDPTDPKGDKGFRADTIATWAEWVGQYGFVLDKAVPKFPFDTEELDEKVQLESQLHTYVDEQLVRFAHGQANMTSDWDAFVDRVNALGAKRLAEIYNAAMNRYLEAAGITL